MRGLEGCRASAPLVSQIIANRCTKHGRLPHVPRTMIFTILELRCGFREGWRQESTLYLDETEPRLVVPGSTSTYGMGCFLLPDVPLDPESDQTQTHDKTCRDAEAMDLECFAARWQENNQLTSRRWEWTLKKILRKWPLLPAKAKEQIAPPHKLNARVTRGGTGNRTYPGSPAQISPSSSLSSTPLSCIRGLAFRFSLFTPDFIRLVFQRLGPPSPPNSLD